MYLSGKSDKLSRNVNTNLKAECVSHHQQVLFGFPGREPPQNGVTLTWPIKKRATQLLQNPLKQIDREINGEREREREREREVCTYTHRAYGKIRHLVTSQAGMKQLRVLQYINVKLYDQLPIDYCKRIIFTCTIFSGL